MPKTVISYIPCLRCMQHSLILMCIHHAGLACGRRAERKGTVCLGWNGCSTLSGRVCTSTLNHAATHRAYSHHELGVRRVPFEVRHYCALRHTIMWSKQPSWLLWINRADRREAFVGENGLDAAQRAALMALTPRDLPAQASPFTKTLRLSQRPHAGRKRWCRGHHPIGAELGSPKLLLYLLECPPADLH